MGRKKKENTFGSVIAFFESPELTVNAFRSGIFPMKTTQRKGRP